MDGAQPVLYPRYLANHLPKQGRKVCVIGQVMNVSENNSLTLECDPENKVQVIVQVPGNIQANPLKHAKFVQVRGICGESGQIVMREYTDMKDNFDLKTYNEIITLTSRQFRDIFNYQD